MQPLHSILWINKQNAFQQNHKNQLLRCFFTFLLLICVLAQNASALYAQNTLVGPYLVKDINTVTGDSEIFEVTPAQNALYFVMLHRPNYAEELWKSDGTDAGTVRVKRFTYLNGVSPAIERLTPAGDKLFFVVSSVNHWRELWVTDGTEAGTMMVKDIHPTDSADPTFLTAVGNTLFFRANDGVHGLELWKSDGTTAGTMLVKDTNPNGDASVQWLTAVGNTLLFAATDQNGDHELWKSDGTANGTQRVKDIHPMSSSSPQQFVAFGNILYFFATNDTDGLALWKSNGVNAGTTLVKALPATVNYIQYVTASDSRIYFITQELPSKLWVNDTATLDEDGAVTISVLQNDNDSNSNLDPATLAIVQQPLSGTVTISGTTGVLVYTPKGNAAGTDSFTYRICDTANACATATVTITINAKNDPPVAVNDSATVVQDSANNVIAVLTNDSDQEKDTLTIQSVGTPDRSGTATSQNNAILYTPAAGFVGNEQFTYTISDGHDGTATATVIVTVTAKEPGSSKKQLFLPTVRR